MVWFLQITEIIKEQKLSVVGRDCYCVGSANLLCKGTCGNRFDNWLPDYNGIVGHKYIFTNMGYNLKPLDLQGAIGLKQLKSLTLYMSKEEKINQHYQSVLKLLKLHLQLTVQRSRNRMVWSAYNMQK